jgi:hypothetical protein
MDGPMNSIEELTDLYVSTGMSRERARAQAIRDRQAFSKVEEPSTEGQTMHSRQADSLNERTGRHNTPETKPRQVGQGVEVWPRLPASSPWATRQPDSFEKAELFHKNLSESIMKSKGAKVDD